MCLISRQVFCGYEGYLWEVSDSLLAVYWLLLGHSGVCSLNRENTLRTFQSNLYSNGMPPVVISMHITKLSLKN
uniref:Uncharacterized protein n=1 Tax=Anguilla anguilla TaxID=7936 RepID=A0A0E9X3B5_ANGAN